MGSYSRPVFDLNEPPADEENGSEEVAYIQHQKLHPTLSSNDNGSPRASSGSGIQPFVRSKDVQTLKESITKKVNEINSLCVSSPLIAKIVEDGKLIELPPSVVPNAQTVEREEGERSDAEDNIDAMAVNDSSKQEEAGKSEIVQQLGVTGSDQLIGSDRPLESNFHDSGLHESIKDGSHVAEVVSGHASLGSGSKGSYYDAKGDVLADGLEGASFIVKPKETKGVEANHALRIANNPGKISKLDEHKEVMLGKKRNRQTVFLNIDEVKQAGAMITTTPKKQSSFPSPIVMHAMKEKCRANPSAAERTVEWQAQQVFKEQRQADALSGEGSVPMDSGDQKIDSNGDISTGLQACSRKISSSNELSAKVYPLVIPRQGSWKEPVDQRQSWNFQVSSKKPRVASQNTVDSKLGNKRSPSVRKQPMNNMLYQDTSIERLLREVTNQKFWHHPEESELQCVPGSFESAEEYVGVFEPLLFEECRAQLYSTWEESTETISRDVHIMVRVKAVERRERESAACQRAISLGILVDLRWPY